MEKRFLTTESKDAFAMIEGKLTNCKLMSVTNDYTGEEHRVLFNVWHNGNTSFVDAEDIYCSEGDFRQGICIYDTCMFISEDIANDYATYQDGKVIYWTFADGEPHRHAVDPTTITYYYNSNDYCFEGIPVGEAYATRQRCLDHNTYKVVDEDGNEREVVGIAKLVALDDDQLQLIKQYNDLLDEIKKQGIVLVYEHETERIHAFSTRNVKGYSWGDLNEEDCIKGQMQVIREEPMEYCSNFEYDFAPCIIRK